MSFYTLQWSLYTGLTILKVSILILRTLTVANKLSLESLSSTYFACKVRAMIPEANAADAEVPSKSAHSSSCVVVSCNRTDLTRKC